MTGFDPAHSCESEVRQRSRVARGEITIPPSIACVTFAARSPDRPVASPMRPRQSTTAHNLIEKFDVTDPGAHGR